MVKLFEGTTAKFFFPGHFNHIRDPCVCRWRVFIGNYFFRLEGNKNDNVPFIFRRTLWKRETIEPLPHVHFGNTTM